MFENPRRRHNYLLHRWHGLSSVNRMRHRVFPYLWKRNIRQRRGDYNFTGIQSNDVPQIMDIPSRPASAMSGISQNAMILRPDEPDYQQLQNLVNDMEMINAPPPDVEMENPNAYQNMDEKYNDDNENYDDGLDVDSDRYRAEPDHMGNYLPPNFVPQNAQNWERFRAADEYVNNLKPLAKIAGRTVLLGDAANTLMEIPKKTWKQNLGSIASRIAGTALGTYFGHPYYGYTAGLGLSKLMGWGKYKYGR